MAAKEPAEQNGYTARDTQLMQELATATGDWSGQLAHHISDAGIPNGGGDALQQNFYAETQNIGRMDAANAGQVTHVTSAQILAAAQRDPRYNQADALGKQILGELYNEKLMGYSGDLGQNTTLAPITSTTPGDLGIQNPSTTGLTANQNNAWSILQNTLSQYGFAGKDLSALTAWAKNEIIKGNSADQITLDLQQTPQFIARFPAIEQRLKAGLPPVTPAEYLSMESSYEQLEHAAGVTPNFASYDKLIAADVSPSEYSDRLTQGYLAVSAADPTVIKAMQDYYHVTQGQLAGYFLDPTKSEPVLRQQALSAQIGGAAAQAKFNNPVTPGGGPEGVSQSEAFRLAQMGVTQAQAQQGFQSLSQEGQLYQGLPGQSTVGAPISTDQLLNSQFGSDGQTKLEMELRAQYEKGTTSSGTQVAETGAGATGTSSVQR